MLTSSAFGPFDPLEPREIRGLCAQNLYIDPIDIDDTTGDSLGDHDGCLTRRVPAPLEPRPGAHE